MEPFKFEKETILDPPTIHKHIYAQNGTTMYKQMQRDPNLKLAPFVRKPNGGPNKWVFPYESVVWDRWLNGDPYQEKIPPPTFPIGNGGFELNPNRSKGEPVYLPKYLRLWDFVHNPDHYVNPELDPDLRKRPFPTYVSDNGPYSDPDINMVPPYLPDTKFEDEPWVISIPHPDNVIHILQEKPVIQKVAFVRAFDTNTDQFKLSPKDIKDVAQPLRLDYNPHIKGEYVIRDVQSLNACGWYYFYRQKVVRSPHFNFPASEATLKAVIDARRNLARPEIRNNLNMAVLKALPKEAVIVNYFQAVVGKNSKDQMEIEQAMTTIDEVKRLVLASFNTPMYVPQYNARGEAIYTTSPTAIYTLELYDMIEREHQRRISLIYPDNFVDLSVPPILSDSIVGSIDAVVNGNNISWTVQSNNENEIIIEAVTPNMHEARINFTAAGVYNVVATIRRIGLDSEDRIATFQEKYVFIIDYITIDIFAYDPDTKSHLLTIAPKDVVTTKVLPIAEDTPIWRIARFSDFRLQRMRDQDEMKRYLAANREKIFNKYTTEESTSTSLSIEYSAYPQYHCVMVQYVLDLNSYIFILFHGTNIIYNIRHFGESIVLEQPTRSDLRTTRWLDPQRRVITEGPHADRIQVHFLSPLDLGVYSAHVFDSVTQEQLVEIDFGVGIRLIPGEDYSIRRYLPNPFLESVARHYTKHHKIDFWEFGRAFPGVLEYAFTCNTLISKHFDAIGFIDDLPTEMIGMAPENMSPPPYIIANSRNEDVFLIFDMEARRWRNMLLFHQDIVDTPIELVDVDFTNVLEKYGNISPKTHKVDTLGSMAQTYQSLVDRMQYLADYAKDLYDPLDFEELLVSLKNELNTQFMRLTGLRSNFLKTVYISTYKNMVEFKNSWIYLAAIHRFEKDQILTSTLGFYFQSLEDREDTVNLKEPLEKIANPPFIGDSSKALLSPNDQLKRLEFWKNIKYLSEFKPRTQIDLINLLIFYYLSEDRKLIKSNFEELCRRLEERKKNGWLIEGLDFIKYSLNFIYEIYEPKK